LSSSDSQPPEPINEAIARLGRRASPRLLWIMAAAAATGIGIILVIDWHRWPLASVLAAFGCFGVWGLVEHHEQRGRGTLRLIQGAAAVLGGIAAIAGLLGVLFWILGPAPIL